MSKARTRSSRSRVSWRRTKNLTRHLKAEIAALTIAIASACAGACSARPERSTVDQFFAASKLRDKTALSHQATVIFEPLENGIVESFEIATVSPEENGTKTVTVSAKVKQPDGAIVQKTILLTLAKDALKNDPAAAGRWIVTGFIERAGQPAIPHP